MGYVADVDGPHPSTLPVWKWWDEDTWDNGVGCGHNGLMDGWRGDETSPPGRVWSCLQGCGRTYYPDGPKEDPAAPTVGPPVERSTR